MPKRIESRFLQKKIREFSVRDKILGTDWVSRFTALSSDEMTQCFTQILASTFNKNIPNKVVKIDDKHPPWITPGLKTATKHKHRVYKRIVQRGRRQEDWALVKNIRNETSKLITSAKEDYYACLGRKLADPGQGVKAYWSALNRLINKKKVVNIPWRTEYL